MISHQNACAKMVQDTVFVHDGVELRWAFVKKALKADFKKSKCYPTRIDVELMFAGREPEVLAPDVVVLDSLHITTNLWPETTKLVQDAWQMK